MKAPSIGYLLPDVKLGGSEKHVIRLASGLRKRGYQAGITCFFQEGSLASEVRDEGIPLVCLKAPGGWGPAASLRLFEWLRSNPVDILHTYLFGFHLFAGLPARLAGVPVILSSRRGRAVTHWQKRRERWLDHLGNLFVDRVVCCSRESAQWTLEHEKIQPDKVVTIHNGIDESWFSPRPPSLAIRRQIGIPDDALLVGTVANFSPEKGYPDLIAAAASVLKINPRTWFLLVGAGPLQEEIRRRAGSIPEHGRIVFAGYRSDVGDLVNAMDIFVLASVIEGFPNVLLESMAMARPVVATRVGGIPELIDSGENGLLVPPRDAEALAQAILSLIADRDRAARMGIQAREKIKKSFSRDRMVDQYEALYLSLLRDKNVRNAGALEVRKTCVESSELSIPG